MFDHLIELFTFFNACLSGPTRTNRLGKAWLNHTQITSWLFSYQLCIDCDCIYSKWDRSDIKLYGKMSQIRSHPIIHIKHGHCYCSLLSTFHYVKCYTICVDLLYQNKCTSNSCKDLSNFQPVDSQLRLFRAVWEDACTRTTWA